ncbi:hypothetical protein [Lutimonas sp.]|uniref:hypothetical protein n=1 Tax=Lutimonas sp. TaxID=1872403 RepID=UPI003D9B985A
MNKQFKLKFAIVLLLATISVRAQKEKLIGFWEIEKVEIGEENMTPVAKWTKINTDGTYQSGNGWLQNSMGTWNYNQEDNTYSAKDSLDIFDEYGGFKVSFDEQKMIWERQEDGMKVKVSLKAIDKLPMSPADYLEGMWRLQDITDNAISVLDDFDKERRHKLFIRWDRIYLNFNPAGKKLSGYWHINGHKPVITLLPHQDEEKAESWTIKVDERELIMTGSSDSNRTIVKRYKRQNHF